MFSDKNTDPILLRQISYSIFAMTHQPSFTSMPTKLPVNLSADHLKSLTVTSRPLMALAEIIWNGLDAYADRVTVRFDRNELDTVETIRVSDDCNGIN